MAKHSTTDRLIVALALALDEIHNPGSARAIGLDVAALCAEILRDAKKENGVPLMIRDEILRREQASAL